MTKEEKNGKYVYTSSVNYPNNSDLTKQRVTVTSDLFIEKVEVLNDKNEAEMIFNVKNIDYSPTFDENYFEVNSIINSNLEENKDTTNSKENTNDKAEDTENKNESSDKETTTDKNTNTTETATLDDIIYPLYLPTGTVLEDQEKVSKTDGERVILTFGGDKGFTLVEETVAREKEFTVIPTYGEPLQVNDTIGAVTSNSLNWISGNVEYYIVSDAMSSNELLDIANSINVSSVSSLK